MRRHHLRNALEFALARSILAVAAVLPRTAMPPIARACGGILDLVLGGRRRVVRENLEIAFPDPATRPDLRTISRGAFTNLCLNFLDLVSLPGRREAVRDAVRFAQAEDESKVRALVQAGPVIFATSHFGAYEAMAMWSGAADIPLCSLVRPLDNPWLEAFLRARRTRWGQVIVGNRGGVRELTRRLAAGECAGILADLNMRGDKRVFVDFFGKPAATATTIARLARHHAAPVVPLLCHREKDPRRFRLTVGRILTPDLQASPEAEDHRILQSVTEDIEAVIRQTPTQWLWTHRRWKTRPAEEGR